MIGKFFEDKKVAVVSDFDNTIGFFRFTPAVLSRVDHPALYEISRDFFSGKIGSREAYRKILSIFKFDKNELLKIIDSQMRIDEGFVELLRIIKDQGWKFFVASDGFKIYIERTLDNYGISPDGVFANEVVFDGNGYPVDIKFPYENPEKCPSFATCKIDVVERLRKDFDYIFYFGDGISDYDVAEVVDFLFSKESLSFYAAEKEIPFFNFKNFVRVTELVKSGVKNIVFDLDGVLVNSEKAILAAINEIREKLNIELLHVDEIRKYIGLPLKEFIEKLVGKFDEEFIQVFREKFESVYLENSFLLPGVSEALRCFNDRGYTLGIITNKKGEYARKLCDHLAISDFMDFVIGEEEYLPQKPDGELWDYISYHNELDFPETLYVGDAEVDLNFARERKIVFAGVAGYLSNYNFLRLGADFVINSIGDLCGVF